MGIGGGIDLAASSQMPPYTQSLEVIQENIPAQRTLSDQLNIVFNERKLLRASGAMPPPRFRRLWSIYVHIFSVHAWFVS